MTSSQQMLPPSGRPSKQQHQQQLLSQRIQTVLDEEDYVGVLSAIIERDYFPHLSAIRGDYGDTSSGISADELHNLTVDSFLRKYTSYDNDSFEDLQQKSVEEHRRKYHWLYEDSISSESKKGMMMLYYIGDKILNEDERKKMDFILDHGVYGRDDSGLGFGAPIEDDNRPNRTESWRFRVRNQLMFPPELKDSEDTCGMHDFPHGIAVDHRTAQKSILPVASGPQSLRITTGDNHRGLQQNIKDAMQFAVSTYNSRVGNAARAEKAIQRHNTSIDSEQLLQLVNGTYLSSHRTMPILELPHTPSLVSSTASEPDNSVGDRKQYRPVPMSPYVEPGQTSVMGALLPIYTWGTIEGPPIPLPYDDALISAMLGSQRRSDHFKQLQQQAYTDLENGVPFFSVQNISTREQIARSMDTSNQQKKLKMTRASHRSADIGDADSVVGRGNYYASSEGSVRTSLGASNMSVAKRFHSLTPAAQALAMKLQTKNKQSSQLF